jgi:hypothetical protein
MQATFNLDEYHQKIASGYRGHRVIESVACWSILDDLEKAGLKGARRLGGETVLGWQPRFEDLIGVLRYWAKAECSLNDRNVLTVRWEQE